MNFLIFIIFLALSFAVSLSFIKRGRYILRAKVLRFIITVAAIVYFVVLFINKSSNVLHTDAMVMQIINKLPQTIDFYVVKINKTGDKKYELFHSGKIRPEYYRLEYFKMENSGEYWIAGYLGKKNMVYFSQHSVPSANIDQIVEVQNYIIQSQKLASESQKIIDGERMQAIGSAIWITLDFLLIFLNIVLLIKRK